MSAEADVVRQAQRIVDKAYRQIASGRTLKLQPQLILKACRILLEERGAGGFRDELIGVVVETIQKPMNPNSPLGRAFFERQKHLGQSEEPNDGG